jgi:O-succinylbenzoate synthase
MELLCCRLQLLQPWVTALGEMNSRDVLLVRVELDGVEGWGECAAQPTPEYSAEYASGAADVISRYLGPLLLEADVRTADDVGPTLRPVRGHPMAKAALETAVLDAELRRSGVSLADDLARRSRVPRAPGGRPGRVVAGVALGIQPSLGELLGAVRRCVDEGYRRVKLKVRPGWDRAPVESVRGAFGADLAVQIDANASYAAVADPAEALAWADGAQVLLIEQPLAADDLLGHAALGAALRTPICLDESITSASDVDTAVAVGACRVVAVKAGPVGGYLEAVRVHDRCAAAGIASWCGGMLETGIGRAANLALATLPNMTLPGDLSPAGRLWAEDLVTSRSVVDPDGTLVVPDGPGIGVEVRQDLDRFVVWRHAVAGS